MTSPTLAVTALASALVLVLGGCTTDGDPAADGPSSAGASSKSAVGTLPEAVEVLPDLEASEEVATQLEAFLTSDIDGFDGISPPTDAEPCRYDVAVYGADLAAGAIDAEIGKSGDPACGAGEPAVFLRIRDSTVVAQQPACSECDDSDYSRLVGLYGDGSPARFTYDFSGRFVPTGSMSG